MTDRLRYVAFSLIFMLFAGPVSAASTNLAIADYASGMYKSATAVAANGAFTMAPAISVAGRSVTVPATARFAANAGQFAVSAIRLNPTVLVAGAVLPYLIGKGIEYANGKFELYESPQATSTVTELFRIDHFSTMDVTCAPMTKLQCLNQQKSNTVWRINTYPTYTQTVSGSPCTMVQGQRAVCMNEAQTHIRGVLPGGSEWDGLFKPVGNSTSCPSGYTLQSGVCNLTNPQNLPVPESKWNEVIAASLPDAVAQELSRAGVALPVEAPTFAPVDEPLGEPRFDPITGRVVQDRVRISQPYPSTNPEIATVIPYTIDAGDAPGQTQEPAASPREISDFQFPSDYARQGEAEAASDKLGDRLLEESPAPTDPETPDEYTDLSENFTGLLGWQLPSHQSQCPTGSFDAWDRTFVFNTHCQIFQDHAQALALVMMVVWTIGALWVVLRA